MEVQTTADVLLILYPSLATHPSFLSMALRVALAVLVLPAMALQFDLQLPPYSPFITYSGGSDVGNRAFQTMVDGQVPASNSDGGQVNKTVTMQWSGEANSSMRLTVMGTYMWILAAASGGYSNWVRSPAFGDNLEVGPSGVLAYGIMSPFARREYILESGGGGQGTIDITGVRLETRMDSTA
jgi:hypothetical protein